MLFYNVEVVRIRSLLITAIFCCIVLGKNLSLCLFQFKIQNIYYCYHLLFEIKINLYKKYVLSKNIAGLIVNFTNLLITNLVISVHNERFELGTSYYY